MPSPQKLERRDSTIRLLFGSVLPAVFGTSVILAFLPIELTSWAFVVYLGQLLAALVLPYALGWVRSIITLVVAGVGALWILSLPSLPTAARASLSLACIAVVGVLAWWSLRLGHVWKPRDATKPGERHSIFPYPYF